EREYWLRLWRIASLSSSRRKRSSIDLEAPGEPCVAVIVILHEGFSQVTGDRVSCGLLPQDELRGCCALAGGGPDEDMLSFSWFAFRWDQQCPVSILGRHHVLCAWTYPDTANDSALGSRLLAGKSREGACALPEPDQRGIRARRPRSSG